MAPLKRINTGQRENIHNSDAPIIAKLLPAQLAVVGLQCEDTIYKPKIDIMPRLRGSSALYPMAASFVSASSAIVGVGVGAVLWGMVVSKGAVAAEVEIFDGSYRYKRE